MTTPPPLADLVEVDRLIHEPARLVIMAVLNTVATADFLYLQRETKLTKGNLSAHMSKLEQAGYIQIEKTFDGKIPRTVCAITESGQTAFQAYLDKMKEALGSIG